MELRLYRFLTYLLIIPNAIIGLIAVASLFLAFLNPVGIFQTAMLAAVVIYAILTFIFLQKGIGEQKKLSFKFKARLRVTGVLSLLLTIVTLVAIVPLVLKPEMLETFITTAFSTAKMSLPKEVPMSKFLAVFTFFMYCWAAYFALLLLHILMTYKLTKEYAETFESLPQ